MPFSFMIPCLCYIDCEDMRTQKLHMLADIGISIVKELNHNVIASRAVGRILLPLSLYQVSLARKNGEVSIKVLKIFEHTKHCNGPYLMFLCRPIQNVFLRAILNNFLLRQLFMFSNLIFLWYVYRSFLSLN